MQHKPVIRTVTEGEEEKVVAGVRIERGIEMPAKRGRDGPWLQAGLALEVGESFVATSKSWIWSKHVKATKRQFAVQKLSSGKFRIWRRS